MMSNEEFNKVMYGFRNMGSTIIEWNKGHDRIFHRDEQKEITQEELDKFNVENNINPIKQK